MTPVTTDKTQVAIIGAGPGGEGAAMRAAKGGKHVTMIERYPRVGGGCTHWGTIPSKALRHAISKALSFRNHPLFMEAARQVDLSFPLLLRHAEQVIDKQVHMRRDFYSRNDVDVLFGEARFLDAHTLAIREGEAERLLTFEHAVIATGSRPYRPEGIDFTHPRIRDSDTVLSMDYTPRTVTVYGAGVIGCEYASMFRNMGAKVNLVNNRDRLLAFLDDEIVSALTYYLRDQGITLRHREQYERVEAVDDGVVLHLQSGKKIKSELLLWAQGRSGNTERLALEAVGIATNARAQLDVDACYRTTQPHIYAVGDVVGYPSLASASYDQGRFAAAHLCDGRSDAQLVEHIPTGIYTDPEISSVGRTERELTDAGVPYEVGHSQFRHLARAQITGHTVGMLKILFHRETLEILGIHCFGDQAAEIVHIGQAILAQKGTANTLRYFVNTTFNYPTMAEAYRVAALNGLNRLC